MKKCTLKALFFLLFASASATAQAQSLAEYINLADTAYAYGKLDSCLFYSIKAEPLLKADSGEYSHAYARFADQYLGFTHEALKHYAEARKWYEKSIEIYHALHEDGPKDFDFGEAANNTGNLYTFLGAYSDALPLMLRAREIFKDIPLETSNVYAAAGNNLANIYAKMGDLTKAVFIFIDLYEKMLALQKSDYNEPCATLLFNLATTYQKQGLKEKSLRTALKSSDIFFRLGPNFQSQYLSSLYNIGAVYSFLEKSDSALQYFTKGFEIAKKAGNNYQMALFAQLMGNINKRTGKYKDAEKQYTDAIRYSLSIDELPTEIYYGAAVTLGRLYYDNRQYRKADSVFTAVFTKAYTQRMPEYKTQEDLYYFFCANAIAQKKYSVASDSVKVFLKLTHNYIRKNFAGMSEEEKTAFINGEYKNFDLQCTMLSLKKNMPANDIADTYTNQLFLKGMVTYSQAAFLRKVEETNDENLKAEYSKWLMLKELLAKHYTLKNNNRFLNTDSLEDASEKLEKKLSIALPGEDIGVRKLTSLSGITEKMGTEDAAVEFVRFNYTAEGGTKDSGMYGAFVIKKNDTVPHFILLCSERKLMALMQNEKGQPFSPNQLIKYLYPSFDEFHKITVSSSNRRVYSLIWQPLLPYLQNVKNILYSPSGLLFNISFNSIYNGKKGLLIDDYHFHNIFSTADINKLQNKTDWSNNPVSIWGNMDYDLNRNYDTVNSKTVAIKNETVIPYNLAYVKNFGKENRSVAAVRVAEEGFWPSLSSVELNALKTDFSSNNIPFSSFEKKAASEDTFKLKMNYYKGTVHISTHGFYAPEKNTSNTAYGNNVFTASINPLLRCGLIFSGGNNVWQSKAPLNGKEDGVLSAYEISQMNLSNVKLITLSACETGLGDIKAYEGVFGLQRAFKIAGAEKMIVSLWKVPSSQTTELMANFYKRWIGGQNIYNALEDTQKDMRKKYSPYYWAGFVLIE
ncbi:MAG TPA: CHAT domain-containing protein [Panacibacter sp.]|nr:CHAT domain-containing protein [Panacibacter sp.]